MDDANIDDEENQAIDVLLIRVTNFMHPNDGFFLWTKNRAFQIIDYQHVAMTSIGTVQPNFKQIDISLNLTFCPQNDRIALIAAAAALHETVLRTWETSRRHKRGQVEFFFHKFPNHHYTCDLGITSAVANCLLREMFEFRKIQGAWTARLTKSGSE